MRIVVAITGATGAAYGVRLLAALDIHLENMLALSRMGAVIAPPALRRWAGMRGMTELSSRLKRPDNAAQGS